MVYAHLQNRATNRRMSLLVTDVAIMLDLAILGRMRTHRRLQPSPSPHCLKHVEAVEISDRQPTISAKKFSAGQGLPAAPPSRRISRSRGLRARSALNGHLLTHQLTSINFSVERPSVISRLDSL
jgi:hypothetical protein